MTSRRGFLQIGVTAATWPLAAGVATAAGGVVGAYGRRSAPLYKVVYDRRFTDSVAFARRMQSLGLEVHGIEGDVTRFWYDDLYHAWRSGPAAIAGMTGQAPLFCLERLAWDQGMRLVFRAGHRRTAGGGVEHDLSGPPVMLQESLSLAEAGNRWCERIADIVAHCSSGPARSTAAQLTVISGAAPVRPAADEPLFSWVLAPVKRG